MQDKPEGANKVIGGMEVGAWQRDAEGKQSFE